MAPESQIGAANRAADSETRHERHLGQIGETRVSIVAEGPKAQWCADVLSAKFESAFQSIKQQVEVIR